MLWFILRWIIGPFFSLVFGKAVLEVCHYKGWYPENELARLMLEAPTLIQLDVAFWVLLAAGTLTVWGGLLFVTSLVHKRDQTPAKADDKTWLKDFRLLLKELRHLRAESQGSTQPASQHTITSHNQSGGITAHDVSVPTRTSGGHVATDESDKCPTVQNPCPKGGFHAFHNGALYPSDHMSGKTFQGPCNKCGCWVDSLEYFD